MHAPTAHQRAALRLLAGGPAHGAALARAAGCPPSYGVHLTAALQRRGLIVLDHEEPGHGARGGGRPAKMWRLTARGRDQVAALDSDC